MGLILGLITPMIVFFIVYFVRFSEVFKFNEYLDMFLEQKQLITFWGVWCLVGNIALFTYYINTHKDNTAKGIFAVTLIYGIGVLLLKLIL